MYRLIFIFTLILFASCKVEQSNLFDEVLHLANVENHSKPLLIKYGKEEGFLEPLMTFGIFTVESSNFKKISQSIMSNKNFKSGQYYFNDEVDDYLRIHKLEILNHPFTSITQNKYNNTYLIYFLSDNRSIAILKINH